MVYLIHLDSPLNPDRPARHYLGWARDLEQRVQAHRAGVGARFLAVAQERGIRWRVVRTWEGSRDLERKLKRQKNTPRFCPICNSKE